jgi:hypothetical protein
MSTSSLLNPPVPPEEPQFFLPFDNFRRNAVPVDLDEYLRLKIATTRFLNARTTRVGMVFAVP